ncbi:MAG: hypothetical protein E6K13_09410 [Methanobacteriota archaeon]|nr:MAG: hypothetical protein E6K13_09410 [Euryarchaeota archaeon]
MTCHARMGSGPPQVAAIVNFHSLAVGKGPTTPPSVLEKNCHWPSGFWFRRSSPESSEKTTPTPEGSPTKSNVTAASELPPSSML